jgi:hypothetical protein
VNEIANIAKIAGNAKIENQSKSSLGRPSQDLILKFVLSISAILAIPAILAISPAHFICTSTSVTFLSSHSR